MQLNAVAAVYLGEAAIPQNEPVVLIKDGNGFGKSFDGVAQMNIVRGSPWRAFDAHFSYDKSRTQ